MTIADNVSRILAELPPGVELVAAAKTRTPAEVLEAIHAGVKIIGENYVKEAEDAYRVVGSGARWHFIGHLQRNKVKRAVKLFDMIETVDSISLAQEIDKQSRQTGKVMPVLIEVNSGRESQKAGVFPEKVEELAKAASGLRNIRVMGLMTMGPRFGDPEASRAYFVATRQIFNRINGLKLPNIEVKYLSMGMTNSYRVAIEEGANIIRIGSRIFGQREPD